jgi:phospholipid/cholesterol/gamma-HCH transport system permease protein
MNEILEMPRQWLGAVGEIGGFMGNILRDVCSLRVFRFFGEALRQSGILIVGSTGVIWGLVFINGLGPCGIQAPACSLPGATCARPCRWSLAT